MKWLYFYLLQYSKNINNNKNDINENNNSQFNKYNTENNYIGYKEEFEDNNPLFQGSINFKEELQNNQNKLSLKYKKSFSNENIFDSKGKIKFNSRMKKNISFQINPLYNNKKILMNLNSHLNVNNNYLSSVNNILLSDNFNSPNLKSIFLDENENNNKEKNIIKQKYINKFNFGIINNKNWGSIIIDDVNIKNNNSYKEHFLIQKNRYLKTPNNIKIAKSKEMQIGKFKQRNKSKL